MTRARSQAGAPQSSHRRTASRAVSSEVETRTNRDVADALAAEGVEVDRRQIVLDDPIKSIGLFTVPVRLHRDVTANVRVYVIRA